MMMGDDEFERSMMVDDAYMYNFNIVVCVGGRFPAKMDEATNKIRESKCQLAFLVTCFGTRQRFQCCQTKI